MDRRNFIKAASVSSLALVPGMSIWAKPAETRSSSDIKQSLENSIHASFGDGFAVVDLQQAASEWVARIVHLENEYLIHSENTLEWRIHSAPPM